MRPEIQGLRAIAVSAVICFHIWPVLLQGGYVGVDIFFVISGYLITGGLFREACSDGTISLLRFYARRVRRLLPAATLVLIVVASATSLLPETRWEETSFEIAASSIFLENWALVWLATDYLSSENAASPVQHYWSLSVEEQFYLVWPILIMAGVIIARRLDWSLRFTLAVALSATFAASLTCSIILTASEPEGAYFLTHTRIWELALGGLLALCQGLWRPGETLRAIAGITGLAAVIAAAVLFSPHTAFTNAAALMATIGAALVIIGADARGLSSYTLLKPRLFQYLGDRSYSIYLWHWPLIVFYGVLLDRNLNWGDGLVVVAATVAVSHFSFLFIEQPFWKGHAIGAGVAKPLGLGFVSVLTCLVAAGAVAGWRAPPRIDASYPGPKALIAGLQVPRGVEPIPFLHQAKADKPVVYRRGCHQDRKNSQPISCTLGDPMNKGEFHIVVAGDSHAAHWIPALQVLAEKNAWKLTTFTKSSCPLARTSVLNKRGKVDVTCSEWRENVIDSILAMSPDLVVTSQFRGYDRIDASMVDGLKDVWTDFIEQGIGMVAIRDTPIIESNPTECLAKKRVNCAVARLKIDDPIVAAAADMPAVRLVDLTAAICGAEYCEPVVGNIVVWRDMHHLTATYAAALADQLAILAGISSAP